MELLADPDQVLLVRYDPPCLRLQRWTPRGGVSDLSMTPDSGHRVLLIDGQACQGPAVDVTNLLEHVPGRRADLESFSGTDGRDPVSLRRAEPR